MGNDIEIKPYTKSDNGMRTLPMPKEAAKIIKEYISTLGETNLFVGQCGAMTLSSYRKMWESIIAKLNSAVGGTNAFPVIDNLTAHIFRHNYCANLCYQMPAISIKKIAQLLGDSDKVVLEVYNHIIDEKEDVHSIVNNALAL